MIFTDNKLIWKDWQLLNESIGSNYSQIVLLTDVNVKKACLPFFKKNFLHNIDKVISLPPGEQTKTIQSAEKIWHKLIQINADKKSLLICLGGGMITDLGGFSASLYKRGIDTICIPTTLLCMTDAAIGGKTGVDLGSLKNMIGVYHFPIRIFIEPHFLKTLPDTEWTNGYAEIIKHSIIEDAHLWKMLSNKDYLFNHIDDATLIRSINIKLGVVSKDPFESSERKKLNFGHTIGHALESHFLESKTPISHGYAIAAGIWIESYLNMKNGILAEDDFMQISEIISLHFPKLMIGTENIKEIVDYVKNDKKNAFGKINIAKIFTIGHSEPVLGVDTNMLIAGLDAYINATSQ